MPPKDPLATANIIVDSLYHAGVRIVFGIPGAKIDSIFDTLMDHPEIRLIVCRHEQNAAFMAAAVGRITGTPGVCIATSGPGASNLTTGLATATTEGDPVVAIIGSVPRLMSLKHTHQSMDALAVLKPISKKTISIEVEDQVAEVMVDAFRTANSYPKGASVISLPMDLATLKSKIPPFPSSAFSVTQYGPSAAESVKTIAQAIEEAKLPVLFLGMRVNGFKAITAIRKFLTAHPIPVVETFQAAGSVPKELEHLFIGRVGLFRNQAGDKLLAKSDLVLTVGYDTTEYDANQWNVGGKLRIVHIDYNTCDYGFYYHPEMELLGALSENLNSLTSAVKKLTFSTSTSEPYKSLHEEFHSWKATAKSEGSELVQPRHFVSTLQPLVSEDTTVICDVGTVYIYMMRFFFAYQPRRFLCSNGQQTLGIALPWAIAANLTQDPPCSRKVISLSGDGGFMFSSQELSTAVQQGCNITHFIWNDEAYNMVQFQEEMKYGRSSGIKLGGVDFVKFAEAFGAKGLRVSSQDELEGVMKEALEHKGVCLVDVRIDYSMNIELGQKLIPEDYN